MRLDGHEDRQVYSEGAFTSHCGRGGLCSQWRSMTGGLLRSCGHPWTALSSSVQLTLRKTERQRRRTWQTWRLSGGGYRVEKKASSYEV